MTRSRRGLPRMSRTHTNRIRERPLVPPVTTCTRRPRISVRSATPPSLPRFRDSRSPLVSPSYLGLSIWHDSSVRHELLRKSSSAALALRIRDDCVRRHRGQTLHWTHGWDLDSRRARESASSSIVIGASRPLMRGPKILPGLETEVPVTSLGNPDPVREQAPRNRSKDDAADVRHVGHATGLHIRDRPDAEQLDEKP